MLLLATILTFSACSDDDDPVHNVVGTTWSASYADELFVIEFESNNKVSGFRADANGNIKGSVYSGTYSINGDKITLNDFFIVIFYRFYFTSGTISGNNMTLNYWWEMGAPNDRKRFDDVKTFHKR